jgi:hypothetical protein
MEGSMIRRRLLSIVGALGLGVGLISSGFAAQAADVEPPTLDALISTWSSSTQNYCYSNSGTATVSPSGACTITQPVSLEDNVAVCIQNNTTVESCVITQNNVNEDNRAIVLQRYSQSGSASETATQRVQITQNNQTGRNDAWDLQLVNQVASPSTAAQTQVSQQFDAIDQNATLGGGQRVSLAQFSYQQENSAVSQKQFSDQDVSDSTHHINQHSSGISKIDVGQAQIQRATGSGAKDQQIDPRCCSVQQSNPSDTINIGEFVLQEGYGLPFQQANSVGHCNTSGHCSIIQSTTQNGVTTPNSCSVGPGQCTAVLSCTDTACGTPTACTGSECSVPAALCPSFVPGCISYSPVLGLSNRLPQLLAVRQSVASRLGTRLASNGALLT